MKLKTYVKSYQTIVSLLIKKEFASNVIWNLVLYLIENHTNVKKIHSALKSTKTAFAKNVDQLIG